MVIGLVTLAMSRGNKWLQRERPRLHYLKQVRSIGRREALAGGSALGATVLGGCLGDDDDDVIDDTDDVDDHDNADDADDADDGDDVEPADDTDDADDDDDPEPIERYDAIATFTMGGPLPADAAYGVAWADEALASWVLGDRAFYSLCDRMMVAPYEARSHLLSDIRWEPGFIEMEFRDDIYWWSGKQLGPDDYLSLVELQDYWAGGDDLDSDPNVIAREQVDDDTVRLALADTWREEWAIQQTIYSGRIESSADFTGPWIEQFDDTGGDLDAIDDVRAELDEHRTTEDDEIIHHFNIPFEFRHDGSIGEVSEDGWVLDLVPEKNGNQRGFVDEINYEHLGFPVREEAGEHRLEKFLEGTEPITRHFEWGHQPEEEIPFDIHLIPFEGEGTYGEWGWNLNAEQHPTNSPQFRRAWWFATRKSDWDQPTWVPQEQGGHPYFVDERLHNNVSEDVIDAMTVYGVEADWDRAEEELELGGFERNADGYYIMQEPGGPDSDAGEPIDIQIGHYTWMPEVSDYGMDWFADIDDFGIQAEPVPGDWEGAWRIEGDFTGGLLPEFTFESIFGESNLDWTAQNNNFPESVMAPEVGDTDAHPDDWVEYDTRAMTDRLGITLEQEAYQELVDQLTWVSNQLMPRATVAADERTKVCNDYHWTVLDPWEHPEYHLRQTRDRMWYTGALQYVPEDER